MHISFYSLWFDLTGNRTRVYRVRGRRSIQVKRAYICFVLAQLQRLKLCLVVRTTLIAIGTLFNCTQIRSILKRASQFF